MTETAPEFENRHPHHWDFPTFELMALMANIQLADTKASIFLAITSGAIAYIVGHWGLDWLRTDPVFWHVLLLGAATAALTVSAVYAFLVIIPRFRKSDRNLIYFGGVAQFSSAEAYAAEILGRSTHELYVEEVTSCYMMAKICDRKYRMLQWSLMTGVAGYAAFLVVLVLL